MILYSNIFFVQKLNYFQEIFSLTARIKNDRGKKDETYSQSTH